MIDRWSSELAYMLTHTFCMTKLTRWILCLCKKKERNTMMIRLILSINSLSRTFTSILSFITKQSSLYRNISSYKVISIANKRSHYQEIVVWRV